MGQYSIKDLEKLSGIKAHTIRIWEKRYAIIKPHRTTTNIRYYTDADLKKLLNITILNNNGYKISKIAALSSTEVNNAVEEISQSRKTETKTCIDQLTLSMVNLDEPHFETLLTQYIDEVGFEKTVLKIMYPFLQKVGILWLSSSVNPAQEHFISNLVRQKIIAGIDELPLPNSPESKKAVLFLPEGELHEIGLLFHYYQLKRAGYQTYYFGQSVPLKDLAAVSQQVQPDILLMSVSVSCVVDQVVEYIAHISTKFPNAQLLITGRLSEQLSEQVTQNVRIIQNPELLIELL